MRKTSGPVSAVSACVLLLILAGCAYKVQVQGVRNLDLPAMEPTGTGILVEPGAHVASGECPVSAEKMVGMVKELARQKGFRIVAREEDADYIMRFDYESVGYEGRVRLQPTSGPATGFKTVSKGGPFDNRLWVRVLDARRGRGTDSSPVLWTGSAALQAAPTQGCRMAALLLVAAFERFPMETGGPVIRRMHVSDSRVSALRK